MIIPNMISLEVTTKCNGGCVMCPQSIMERRNEDMSLSDAHDIVCEAYQYGIRRLSPHGYGESTKWLYYAPFIGWVKTTFPDMKITDTTNGSMLHHDYIRDAICENVDELIVSIDGVFESTNVAIRPGINYEKVILGLGLLRTRDKRPKVILHRIRMPENRHESDELYRECWKPYADSIVFADASDLHGLNPEIKKPIRTPGRCKRPFNSVWVNVRGDVILCCRDQFSSVIYGNTHEAPLKKILEGPRRKAHQAIHETGRTEVMGLCKDCTYTG